jgi:hypothetical protein
MDLTDVYGWVKNQHNEPIKNVVVNVELEKESIYDNGLNEPEIIPALKYATTTNELGYFSLLIANTENMEPNTLMYIFSFSHDLFEYSEKKSIPNVISANYGDL